MTAPAPRGRAEPRGWLGDVVLLAPKFVLTGLLILAIADMVFGVFMRYVVTASPTGSISTRSISFSSRRSANTR